MLKSNPFVFKNNPLGFIAVFFVLLISMFLVFWHINTESPPGPLDNTTWYAADLSRGRVVTMRFDRGVPKGLGFTNFVAYELRGGYILFEGGPIQSRRLGQRTFERDMKAGSLFFIDGELQTFVFNGTRWNRDKKNAEDDLQMLHKQAQERRDWEKRENSRQIVDTETGVVATLGWQTIQLEEEKHGSDIVLNTSCNSISQILIPGHDSGRYRFIYKEYFISYFDYPSLIEYRCEK